MTFQLNKSYFNLIDTITITFNTLKFLADQKQVKLKLLVDPMELKYFYEIYGDCNRYEQMLVNFVSNAIKFTSPNSQVEIILQATLLNQSQFKDEPDENQARVIEDFRKINLYADDTSEVLYSMDGNLDLIASS